MTDSNLIACLYPLDDKPGLDNALRTVRSAENSSRCFEPLIQDRSRQSSPAPGDHSGEGSDKGSEAGSHEGTDDEGSDESDDESDDDTDAGNDYSPGLQLRFDDWRKNQVGFVFGTSPSCDIVLPRRDSLKGLPSRQCALTFDDQGRLVVRDLQDRNKGKGGTAVNYGAQGGQKRRSFSWIVSCHTFTTENTPIVLVLHKNLKFQLVVARHDIGSAEYQQNVAQFASRVSAHVDDLRVSFGGLGLRSPDSTAGPSADAVLLNNGELGRGGQAVVVRVWDVSTGLDYASKEPLTQKSQGRLKGEVELLRQVHHDHIVQCLPGLSTTAPVPRLLLECFPLGSVDDQDNKKAFSAEETLQVLHQSLSALRYLHERKSPIVHRDIKPNNILVHSRTPHLHIKLSDFGFAKASKDNMRTNCGTRSYMAPEMFKREAYNAAVDIWSLGVVVYELAHGLPSRDRERGFDGFQWTEKIVRSVESKAEKSDCYLLIFLSRTMLVKDPELRHSARRCSELARYLDVSSFCCSTILRPSPGDSHTSSYEYYYYDDES
ncbi:kinase-like domain-containing protein [Parachaetomium inaequale]|uniref:Kinase-like domain-containing protein n=1 Tax=Parachaetomium inaequale TaxID=2588326 RepID=A0AAN6PI73_9PEZI|nr:kinase-like domain-containing protein [Parachaetomium inaequale]